MPEHARILRRRIADRGKQPGSQRYFGQISQPSNMLTLGTEIAVSPRARHMCGRMVLALA
jgi:hypothetical protein